MKDRITQRVDRLRKRRPFVDHLVRTFEHYGAVKGNLQAGAITYFGFLSVFPILAIAFAVVGYVARIYPDAQADLVEAINGVLPGMVSQEEAEGKIAIADIQAAAPGILTGRPAGDALLRPGLDLGDARGPAGASSRSPRRSSPDS